MKIDMKIILWGFLPFSGDRIPVGARFSAPVQTGPGAHPASCPMDTGSFPGVKSGRGVTLTPHPLLVPWSRKGRAIPLLPLWAVRPIQSLSACTRVHFTSYPFVVLISSTNLQSPPGTLHSTTFHIQELCVLPTQHIHVFCTDLSTNINYFPVQR